MRVVNCRSVEAAIGDPIHHSEHRDVGYECIGINVDKLASIGIVFDRQTKVAQGLLECIVVRNELINIFRFEVEIRLVEKRDSVGIEVKHALVVQGRNRRIIASRSSVGLNRSILLWYAGVVSRWCWVGYNGWNFSCFITRGTIIGGRLLWASVHWYVLRFIGCWYLRNRDVRCFHKLLVATNILTCLDAYLIYNINCEGARISEVVDLHYHVSSRRVSWVFDTSQLWRNSPWIKNWCRWQYRSIGITACPRRPRSINCRSVYHYCAEHHCQKELSLDHGWRENLK